MTATPSPSTPLPVPANLEAYADGRLSAAAARRNTAPLTEALRPHLPPGSRVLELASGTGEHAVALCRACPGLHWQPTEIAPERRASIAAWTQAEQLQAAIQPPLSLDVAQPWPVAAGQWDGVLAVNLLHIMSGQHLPALFVHARSALAPGGWLMVYGPFRRGDEWYSEGNQSFHAQLQALDPDMGLRDMDVLDALAQAVGLNCAAMAVERLPANNHLLRWRRG